MRPDSTPSRPWLWATPVAWGMSTLLIVGESGWLPLVACSASLCVGLACCPRILRRRAVASLLALALPVQGFAGISMQVRGPAHYHLHEASHHAHVHVERHHHAADEAAIEIDDARHQALAAGQDKRTAFSSLDT